MDPYRAHRAAVNALCNNSLSYCRAGLQNNPQFDFAACINQEKDVIKRTFAGVPDINGLVENRNWNPAPLQQGGKRKSTRRNTRRNRKNIRKHRRSSRKF